MKLVELIVAAVALLAGFRTTIRNQQTALQEKDATIADLGQKLADDALDDAALEDARAAAEAKTAELQAELDALKEPAEALAAAVNAHDEVPVTDADFSVTEPTADPAATA